jgi:hypothetical protein
VKTERTSLWSWKCCIMRYFEGSTMRFFLFVPASGPALGPIQHPIQWVPEAISPGVKRPAREADYSV